MKPGVIAPVIILFLGIQARAQLSTPPSLPPLTDSDLTSVRSNLQSQAEVLQQESPSKCASGYDSIFRSTKSEVHLSLFYGYQDAKTSVTDGPFAAAMIGQLQKPCLTSAVEACGFALSKTEPGLFELVRNTSIDGRPKRLRLTVAYPSISYSHLYNTDLQRGYWDQKAQSLKTKAAFYEALKTSQVVFYDGHSRMGAGPGFSPVAYLNEIAGGIRRKSIQELVFALSEAGPALQIFGSFSCKSERHFEDALLRARPNLGIIVTTSNVDSFDSEQSVFGALNAILAQKCEPDFAKSLIPAGHPDKNLTVLKNFFKRRTHPETTRSR